MRKRTLAAAGQQLGKALSELGLTVRRSTLPVFLLGVWVGMVIMLIVVTLS